MIVYIIIIFYTRVVNKNALKSASYYVNDVTSNNTNIVGYDVTRYSIINNIYWYESGGGTFAG